MTFFLLNLKPLPQLWQIDVSLSIQGWSYFRKPGKPSNITSIDFLCSHNSAETFITVQGLIQPFG